MYVSLANTLPCLPYPPLPYLAFLRTGPRASSFPEVQPTQLSLSILVDPIKACEYFRPGGTGAEALPLPSSPIHGGGQVAKKPDKLSKVKLLDAPYLFSVQPLCSQSYSEPRSDKPTSASKDLDKILLQLFSNT